MMNATRGLGFAATLTLISSVAVVPRASGQSTAAYVYVQSQGAAGPVYGFSANTNGQLAAIPGSPFKPGTAIVGGNGSQFFTLGHTLLHSYAVGSNGAIGSQLSDIAIMNYAGGSCGGTADGDNGAVLDHTGKFVYVLEQYAGDWSCSAYQSYQVNSDGSFTFVGDTEENWGDQSGEVDPSSSDLPSILGSENFAYADQFDGHQARILGFVRDSYGELQTYPIGEVDPTPSGGGSYTVELPDASPTGSYIVAQMYPNDSNPPQLGVYTVDRNGNLSTTNTASNMPTSALDGPNSTFSPDGKLYVLFSGQGSGTGPNSGNGIEIYNFNGASPLTLNRTLLAGTPVDEAAWDSSNHLYAISRMENKVYVFTVTATSAMEDSSTSISDPLGLVVVSKASTGGGGGACTAPTGNGVNVCSPAEGATVSSPVQISAAATVSGGVYRFEVWNGSTKLLSSDSGTINQSVSLAAGSYKLTFDAYNSSKSTHEYAYRDITVK